jgi:hypothetical protein
MKRNVWVLLPLATALFFQTGCDSKPDPVTKGREAVKEVVTQQPFNTLENAKDSLSKSEDKTKAAIEELEKESRQP